MHSAEHAAGVRGASRPRPRGACTPRPPSGPRAWLRPACGAVIVAVLLAQFGTGPFVAALETVTGWALAIAMAVTLVTTACCAWRWSVVARELEVDVRLPAAVAAYYRSQFLNSTLPGGVLGDVHRAVRHGRDVGAMGRSARSVAWERTLGQAVQVVLTVLLLAMLPSPVRPVAGVLALGLLVAVVAGGGIALVGHWAPRHRRGLMSRGVRAVVDDLRRVLLTRRAWPVVLLTSTLVVAGHVGVFLIAMRAAEVEAMGGQQIALAALVLLAAAVPANLAGWGPREGVAAWAFGAAGVGAATGVTVAVLYGVLALVATLPGALVLVLVLDRRRPRLPDPTPAPGPTASPSPSARVAP